MTDNPDHRNANVIRGRIHVYDGLTFIRAIEMCDGRLTIGRDKANDIVIRDHEASRFHCELDIGDCGITLRDCNSKNGTLVNKDRITTKHLADGDKIKIGMWRLLIRSIMTPSSNPDNTSPVSKVSYGLHRNIDTTLCMPSTASLKLVLSQDNSGIEDLARINDILSTLYQAGEVLNAPKQGLHVLLNTLLDLIFRVLPADRGVIMLYDRVLDQLIPQATRNLTELDEVITVSETITQQVFNGNVGVITTDAISDERFHQHQSIVQQHVRSALCAPLSSPNNVHGIFYIDNLFASGMYTAEHLKLLTAIGRQAGTAIENIKLYQEQKQTFESLMETLAATIDARDPLTAGHSKRVAGYSAGIAKALGLSEAEQERILYAAFLHDYGKIAVPDAILCKPGKLTHEEYEIIKKHANYTSSILSRIHFFKDYQSIPDIAAGHHERMDGQGYPNGLHDQDIPLGARIIAVADVFDALMSRRHYKEAMSLEHAYQELDRIKGTHLDPDIVDTFKQYHRNLTHMQSEVLGSGDTEDIPVEEIQR